MSKFSLDYDKLENKLLKKAYRLEEVKDKIERVAFDVVRFKDSDSGSALWQIQSADDGEYIVALYDNTSEETTKTASLPWEVVFSKTAKTLDVFYKGEPLVRVAVSKLGLPVNELSQVESYLPKKLAENKKLVSALLKELSEPTKKAVLNKYPELA